MFERRVEELLRARRLVALVVDEGQEHPADRREVARRAEAFERRVVPREEQRLRVPQPRLLHARVALVEVDEDLAEHGPERAEVRDRLVAAREAGVVAAGADVERAQQVAAHRVHRVVLHREFLAEPLEQPELPLVDLVAVAREQPGHDLHLGVQLGVRGRRVLPERVHLGQGLVQVPAPGREEDRREAHPREPAHDAFVQRSERPFDQPLVALHGEQPAADRLEDRGDEFGFRAGLRVLQGRKQVSLLLEPGRRARVQLPDVRAVATQALQEELAEQPVVTEPLPRIVHRVHEQVPAFEFLQHGPSPGLAVEATAEVPVDALEDGRAQEELLLVPVQAAEHLLEEVPGEVRAAAGEVVQRGLELVAVVEPAAHHLQRRRPAFRAFQEAFDHGVPIPLPEPRTEVGLHVVRGETQLAVRHLEQPVVQAEVRGHQFRRQRPRAEHDPEAPRQVLHEKVQAADDIRARGAVQVIEDQDVLALAGGQRGEQQAARRVRVLRLDPLAAAEEPRFGARLEEVPRELVHRRVELVERQPRDAASVFPQAAEPLPERRGLAVARGRVHERQPHRPQGLDAFRFQAALHPVRHGRARLQLGAGKEAGSVPIGAHDRR